MGLSKKIYVIIAAAGMGTRLKHAIPKALVHYKKRALILHTLDTFFEFKDRIEDTFVCFPKDHKKEFETLLNLHPLRAKLVCGADTRAKSVYEAVKHLPNEGLVLIHDGARPFAKQCIDTVLNAPDSFKAVIPTLTVTDTLKEVQHSYVIKTHKREHFHITQTPQRFCIKSLKLGYQSCKWEHFSDESQIIEAIGEPIFCVPGDTQNTKITFPEDLESL